MLKTIFNVAGSGEGETKASISPAIASSGMQPAINFAACLLLKARTSDRRYGPGSIKACPITKPAPPAMNIAVNSEAAMRQQE